MRQARVETRRSVQQGTQICKGVGNKIKVQQKTGKTQKTKDKEKSKKKNQKPLAGTGTKAQKVQQ